MGQDARFFNSKSATHEKFVLRLGQKRSRPSQNFNKEVVFIYLLLAFSFSTIPPYSYLKIYFYFLFHFILFFINLFYFILFYFIFWYFFFICYFFRVQVFHSMIEIRVMGLKTLRLSIYFIEETFWFYLSLFILITVLKFIMRSLQLYTFKL